MVNRPKSRARYRGRGGTKRRGRKRSAAPARGSGGERWAHEGYARRVFEHAFWPPKAPPCERCPRRKTKCPRCTAIETRRVYYQGPSGRKRRFDFDIVLKVPAPGRTDAAGHPLYRPVVVVEIDGPSHYRSIEQFGGRDGYADQVRRDAQKMRWCEENGVLLVRIPCYFEQKRTRKLVRRVDLFKKLVHARVWDVREYLERLGGEARRLLDIHWSDEWFLDPVATTF